MKSRNAFEWALALARAATIGSVACGPAAAPRPAPSVPSAVSVDSAARTASLRSNDAAATVDTTVQADAPLDGGVSSEFAAVDASATEGAPVEIEEAASLGHLFDRFATLEAGGATTDVCIVQFGDSHTQPDLGTGSMRRALQARFGDGGRGFVPVMLPANTWLQSGVHAGASHEWTIGRMKVSKRNKRNKLEKPKLTGDGLYGLAGVSAVASRAGGTIWLEVPTTTQLEVAYLEQPHGGAFDVVIDGSPAAHVRTARRGQPLSAFRKFDLSDAPHRIELRSAGGGEARVFGVGLDRKRVGVTLDALGISGSRASGILEWNEAHFAEQLRHRAPDLVIFAYGTNEASSNVDIPTYERQLTEVVGRVHRATPEASCLLLGPPDWAPDGPDGRVTPPKLLEVMAAQRRVSTTLGCAYFSQFDVMGGAGTMEAWATADPPLARPDRVHMTKAGYELLGNAFTDALLTAYGAWGGTHRPAQAR